jgi:two-component system, OmpR family, alkaline phosphatase synthesis response regulator PhoP
MQGKVLIADDERHIRMLMEQALEGLLDEGVEILAADNGAEALRLVQSERPDLVFLDAMMPAIDGFEVCRVIKHELGLSDVYVAMLTAKGQEADRQRGERAGADLYLTKPFDPDELVALAHEVLSRHRTH